MEVGGESLGLLYAWIDWVKRPPAFKGEHTTCRDCGGLLTAVIPVENVRHWRHKAGDCDPWSEPEGVWHLGWKEKFDIACREIGLVDATTGERHRADVLCGMGTDRATVLELQHSSISEDERNAREAFYRRAHRMFWLIHIHNETSFLAHNFGMSMDFQPRTHVLDGKKFAVMRWAAASSSLKSGSGRRPTSSSIGLAIYSILQAKVSQRLGGPLKRGHFALCHLTSEEFLRAVHWHD